jgi:hypothetical protein
MPRYSENKKMKMKTDTPARVATVTLENNEPLDIAALDLFVNLATLDPVGLWAVDLIIEPEQLPQYSAALQQRKFHIAGTLSADVTTLRLRLNLRNSTDDNVGDPNLAVTACHPGNAADNTILPNVPAWLESRYSDESVSRRAAQIAIKRELRHELADFDNAAKADAERLAPASLRTEDRRKEQA